MTQASRPQAEHIINFPLPSDPGPYSGDQWAELFEILFTQGYQAVRGPFYRDNNLEVTDNASTEVYVDTGAGMVNGHALISNEKETWVIPAGPVGVRTDRVVMVENNTNIEVTQSTAGRPLLFPNDLTEYTATPGVPAYSTRLAILRGNDAGALPALDQSTSLYMVELARYDINNAPTISSATDYREFVDAETKRFLVPVQTARDIYTPADLIAWNPHGLELGFAVNTHVYPYFAVPNDFISAMTVTPFFVEYSPTSAGNVLLAISAYYEACGEVYSTHSVSIPNTAYAMANIAFMTHCPDVFKLSLAQAAIGDIVHVNFLRVGVSGLNTYGHNIFTPGVIVEYFGWGRR